MVTIAQAALATGVPAATLRIWERRYGVPRPERTGGGYRTYGPRDLTAITRMRDLVAEGMSPSAAASVVADGGVSTIDPERFVEDLLDPDSGLDVERELGVCLRSGDLAVVVDEWLLPMLAQLGKSWESGELTIGVEHALSASLMRQLSVLWQELPEGTRSPTVLAGLPGGAHHDITLFCFALLLRREGFRVRYLGANLPASAWSEAVAQDRPCVVITAVHGEKDLPATEELVRRARLAGAGFVAVGGGWQDSVEEPSVRLGHTFGPALERFVAMV